MSGPSPFRGSATPSGLKRAPYAFPADASADTNSINTSSSQLGLSKPIHIASRSTPRSTSSSSSQLIAQSAPTPSWQPPPPPTARPRVPSCDPPPMALPPSPPVFSPMDAQQIHSKKEESTSKQLKKQIYSRSLSNYSSSAPTHVDYLSNFQPTLTNLEEDGGLEEEEDQESEEERETHVSVISVQDRSRIESAAADGGPKAIPRALAQPSPDDFSLSKSPTIFSMLSTSQQARHYVPSGLAQSAFHSGSPTSILGQIAAGDADALNAPPHSQAGVAAHKKLQGQHDEHDNPDDLQFNISLTDEGTEENEHEDQSAHLDVPLY